MGRCASWPRSSSAWVVLSVFATVLALSAPSGAGAQTAGGVEVRDRLVADQENLLNAYRCKFGVDIDVIPGQCPNPDIVAPGVSPESPTHRDLVVRDQLIADQEALLNVYRCAYNIDIGLVVGGCDSASPPAVIDVSQNGFVSVSAGANFACGIKSDGSSACWGPPRYRFKYNKLSQYSLAEVSVASDFACGLRTDTSIACLGRGAEGTDTKGRYGDRALWQWQDGGVVVYGGGFSAVSTGGEHHCAIRLDQSVVCFGELYSGKSYTPPGSYSAISAGSAFGCAIRVDKTINCWTAYANNTSNNYVADSLELLNVPDGRYTAVSISNIDHKCSNYSGSPDWEGLLINCSVGNYACALGVDQAIVCWGDNSEGQTDVPDGRFSAISAGGNQTCGLRLEGTIVCWGFSSDANIAIVKNVPSGQFRTIATSEFNACAVRLDGTLSCWGLYPDELSRRFHRLAPSGAFFDISFDTLGRTVCAIRGDRTATCFLGSFGTVIEIPGKFVAVENLDKYDFHVVCLTQIDQTFSCLSQPTPWNNEQPDYDYLEPFIETDETEKIADVSFVEAFYGFYLCYIRADRHLFCGDTDSHWLARASFSMPVYLIEEKAIDVAMNNERWSNGTEVAVCIITDDHSLRCIGDKHSFHDIASADYYYESEKDEFTDVEIIDQNYICAIRINQTMTCWNTFEKSIQDSHLDAQVFSGLSRLQTAEKFTAIFASRDNSLNNDSEYICGIKTDGSIACYSWVTNLPDGVSHLY